MYTIEKMVIESSNGGNNWISIWIPPLIALIGVVITLFLNYRQNIKNNDFIENLKHAELEATIVRTTRLKWIDEVREILSELMAVIYRLETNAKRKVHIKGTSEEELRKKSKLIQKIEEDYLRSNYLVNKLRYYISIYSFRKNEKGEVRLIKNKRNISFQRYINNLVQTTTDLANAKTIEEYESIVEKLKNNRTNLSRYSSAYLKREWDRVKDFKKTP